MIVIDGYNFAYKIPSFLERLYRREALTVHPEVVELLSGYLQRHPKEQILIVWDGYPPQKKIPGPKIASETPVEPAIGPIFFPSNTLTVQYGGDFSADFVIKNYLKKRDFPPGTQVVSSDKELIKETRKKKAISILSEDFATRILTELEEEEEANKTDDLAVEGWLDLFKKGPGK